MLAMMMNVLAPCAEWGWLYRHPAAPRRHEAAEARQAVPVVEPGYLLAGLESAMDQLLREPISKVSALRLRDLLIVAVTATTALRRRNIIALTIGESIFRHQHGYEIRFTACAVKNSRAISMTLMPQLIDGLDRYIDSYRPLLLGGQEDTSRALWVSNLARRLASNSMNAAFRQITSELLGRQVNPHSLRHSAATAILIQDPLASGRAAATLAHGSEATLDRYYDLSGDAAAQALWCKLSMKYRAHAKGDGRSGMLQGSRARSGTTGFQ
jgi:integrase